MGIARALKHGIPVAELESWDLSQPDGRPEPLLHAEASPAAAGRLALALAEDIARA